MGRFGALLLMGLAAGSCKSETTGTPPGTPPAMQVVGPAGGNVALANGAVSVSVPAGAVTGSITLTVAPTTDVPAGHIGMAVEIGPSGTKFDVPVTITFHVGSETMDSAGVPTVGVATVVDGKWVPLEVGSFDAETGRVSALTTHFSRFGALAMKFHDPAAGAGSTPDEGSRASCRAASTTPNPLLPPCCNPVAWAACCNSGNFARLISGGTGEYCGICVGVISDKCSGAVTTFRGPQAQWVDTLFDCYDRMANRESGPCTDCLRNCAVASEANVYSTGYACYGGMGSHLQCSVARHDYRADMKAFEACMRGCEQTGKNRWNRCGYLDSQLVSEPATGTCPGGSGGSGAGGTGGLDPGKGEGGSGGKGGSGGEGGSIGGTCAQGQPCAGTSGCGFPGLSCTCVAGAFQCTMGGAGGTGGANPGGGAGGSRGGGTVDGGLGGEGGSIGGTCAQGQPCSGNSGCGSSDISCTCVSGAFQCTMSGAGGTGGANPGGGAGGSRGGGTVDGGLGGEGGSIGGTCAQGQPCSGNSGCGSSGLSCTCVSGAFQCTMSGGGGTGGSEPGKGGEGGSIGGTCAQGQPCSGDSGCGSSGLSCTCVSGAFQCTMSGGGGTGGANPGGGAGGSRSGGGPDASPLP